MNKLLKDLIDCLQNINKFITKYFLFMFPIIYCIGTLIYNQIAYLFPFYDEVEMKIREMTILFTNIFMISMMCLIGSGTILLIVWLIDKMDILIKDYKEKRNRILDNDKKIYLIKTWIESNKVKKEIIKYE